MSRDSRRRGPGALVLLLLLASCGGLGLLALWWWSDRLGPWAYVAGMGWIVLVSKVMAVALAVRASAS